MKHKITISGCQYYVEVRDNIISVHGPFGFVDIFPDYNNAIDMAIYLSSALAPHAVSTAPTDKSLGGEQPHLPEPEGLVPNSDAEGIAYKPF